MSTWNLGSKAKQVVLNVYNYFVRDAKQDSGSCTEHTAIATLLCDFFTLTTNGNVHLTQFFVNICSMVCVI